MTANTNRATLKWRALVAAATPLPSSCNAGCASCTPPAAAPPAGAVGAYGGAKYGIADIFALCRIVRCAPWVWLSVRFVRE